MCTCFCQLFLFFFFFSSRRRHTRSLRDWSSDVCSSDLISLHRPWRRTKGCRCRKAFDFACSLKLAPMSGNFLPVVVQFLRIARLHDCQHRLPAHRHFVHDRLKRATGTAVFWLQRTCARLKVKRWDRRKPDYGQQQQKRTRENQHGRRAFHAPPQIFFYHLEDPIMTKWGLPFANKKK